MPAPIPPPVIAFLPAGAAKDELRALWLEYRAEALSPDSPGGSRVTLAERQEFMRWVRQRRAELAPQIRAERQERAALILAEVQAFFAMNSAKLHVLIMSGLKSLGIDKDGDGVISDGELEEVVRWAAERVDQLVTLPPVVDDILDAVVLMALDRAARAVRNALAQLGSA